MSSRSTVLLLLLFMGGCLWPVQRDTDRTVVELSARPYDVAPQLPAEKPKVVPKGGAGLIPPAQTDIQTTALMMQAGKEAPAAKGKAELEIPDRIPGSETPRVVLPRDKEAQKREVERIYPPLLALPTEPKPQSGPDGRAYTLADFQRIAAEESPTLRQAASDVEAARGSLIQAKTYTNPNVSVQTQATNNNSIAGVHGVAMDQVINTAGKMGLGVAVAQKNLDNAELALRRARSDLSTAVRNAFYGFLVARETMIVNRALAEFTDAIYRRQADLLQGALAAAYEPASLRAQAYTARLAYKQSISSYIYAWKQLVAAVGLRQLPLSEVEGHIDRLIPYFDYDAVLQHVLNNHTDVLTARNAVDIGRYNLKLAQVTPIPNVDVNVGVFKDTTLSPFGMFHTVSLSMPLPIWDLNKGNIIAAQAALIRAGEESHRVEMNLTNGLAAAYTNYKNNLDALEYYRRYILPDQVRYYRGIFNRREVDPNSAFGDLVQAQQTLAANVTTYLGILGTLWSSAVSVADFLQTDDLFQKAQPMELPPLPPLDQLPQWPCPHPGGLSVVAGGGEGCVVHHTQCIFPATKATSTTAIQTPAPVIMPPTSVGTTATPAPAAPTVLPAAGVVPATLSSDIPPEVPQQPMSESWKHRRSVSSPANTDDQR
jgi:cobalt-zinc-cadmium efflux system outer membrane protein